MSPLDTAAVPKETAADTPLTRARAGGRPQAYFNPCDKAAHHNYSPFTTHYSFLAERSPTYARL